MSAANIKPASTASEAGFPPAPSATRQRAAGLDQQPSAYDDAGEAEWVLWLQRDAAYTYRMASEKRDSSEPAAAWVATLIQNAAAHSAKLAREALGIGDGACVEAL